MRDRQYGCGCERLTETFVRRRGDLHPRHGGAHPAKLIEVSGAGVPDRDKPHPQPRVGQRLAGQLGRLDQSFQSASGGRGGDDPDRWDEWPGTNLDASSVGPIAPHDHAVGVQPGQSAE